MPARAHADPAVFADPPGRIAALDILRGFALFGMIVVHFHQRFRLSTEAVAPTPGEDGIATFIWMAIEQKSWATFAFLFGVGFAVLLRRAEQSGRAIVPFYLRRLAGLAAIAIPLFVFTGFTILLDYALWGVPLLFIRKWPTRALLVGAIVAAAAWTFVPLGSAIYDWVSLGREGADLATSSAGALTAASVSPESYLDLMGSRLQTMSRTYLSWRAVIPQSSFTLFILGLLAVRHGVFDEPRRRRGLIITAMSIGLVSWVLAWWGLPRLPAGLAPQAVADLLHAGLGIVSEQWLAFTYIGALVLLLTYRPRWTARLAWMGVAGRMALTNYVLQCVVIEALSSRFGFGLHLRVYAYVAGGMLLFLAEALFSRAWLSRFRYGPLEWCWRGLTYLQVPPMAR